MAEWIVIPSWSEFQHYKTRNPVWIKNYCSLLSNPDYLGLSSARRGLLHSIWIAYAAGDGLMSGRNLARLGRQLGLDLVRRRDLKALVDAGFIEMSASRPLALRYQVACLEKERERDPLTPTAPLARAGGDGVDKPRFDELAAKAQTIADERGVESAVDWIHGLYRQLTREQREQLAARIH